MDENAYKSPVVVDKPRMARMPGWAFWACGCMLIALSGATASLIGHTITGRVEFYVGAGLCFALLLALFLSSLWLKVVRKKTSAQN
jgi:hypothetical protein